jgi:hypothetical protein
MKRSTLIAVALVVVVVGSAACGGASTRVSSPTGLGKAFRSKALAECAAALAAKKAQGPFPYPHFNPTRPDLSKLPRIARSEAKTVRIYRRWLRTMLALGQPPSGRAAWADLIDALRGHVRVIVEQQAAAARRDGATFTKDYYAGNKVQEKMVRAADAAGVPECAAAAAA